MSLRLFVTRREPIKRMPGFEAHHRVPTASDHRSQGFVEALTRSSISEELQRMLDRIRDTFQFKRREISTFGPEHRRGVIETPLFVYEVSVTVSSQDPSCVEWRYELTIHGHMNEHAKSKIDQCMGKAEWVLELALDRPVDLEYLIDCIEDRDAEQLKVRYDKDLEWCDLSATGTSSILRFTKQTVVLRNNGPVVPSALLDSLARFHDHLHRHGARSLLPAHGAAKDE